LRKNNEQFPWQHDGFVHNNSKKQEVFLFPVVTLFGGSCTFAIIYEMAVSFVSNNSSHTVGDTICSQWADTSVNKSSQKMEVSRAISAVLGYT